MVATGLTVGPPNCPNAVGVTASAGVLAGQSLTTCTVQAQNSATGELSAVIDIIGGSKAYAAINDVFEAGSTNYALPPPKAPLLNSVFSGCASLSVAMAPGSKSQQVELWENAVNNSATATLVGTATNSGATFLRTGTPGATKFYWARTKNATDSKFSGFSNPALVVL